MTLELLKVLHPRAYEPMAKRNLRSVFWRVIQERAKENEVREAVGEIVFNAFLGGKLQAARDVRERFSMIHDEDLQVVKEKKAKYVVDFTGILGEYRRGEKLQKCYRRLDILGQVSVWELYNLGKVSRFREHALKMQGITRAQASGYLTLIQAHDCCDECRAKSVLVFSLWGPIELPPFHPHCRCELTYVPWKTAQALIMGGKMVALGIN